MAYLSGRTASGNAEIENQVPTNNGNNGNSDNTEAEDRPDNTGAPDARSQNTKTISVDTQSNASTQPQDACESFLSCVFRGVAVGLAETLLADSHDTPIGLTGQTPRDLCDGCDFETPFAPSTSSEEELGRDLAPAAGVLLAVPLRGKSVATVRGPASSAVNAVRLRNQLTSQEIAAGHAFEKHVLQNGEFSGVVTTRAQFANLIEGILGNPSATRQLSNGRTAYWDDATGTVVIRNSSSADGGTAFQPTLGKQYFDEVLH